MNVSLTPELEKFIEAKVQSGRYQTASEVVREGLRALEDQERLREMQFQTVREKIREGLEQLDRGEGISGEELEATLKKVSAEFRAKKK